VIDIGMKLTFEAFASTTHGLIRLVALLALLVASPSALAGKISLSVEELDIREVMQMLSREQRMNIFVAEGVSGDVSVNLYDMDTSEAVRLIAESAGFVVEQRNDSFFVIEREDAGKLRQSDRMEVRAFKVQYASTSEIETILQEYLSEYGNIKALPDNDMLVIEDLPSFLNKMETLLGEIDREPKQIMIEAKILEITLTDNQSYGLDWAKLFDSSDGTGSLGTQGLANPNSAGLFAQYTNSNVELVLNALKARGRLRTISTPKLLAMEGLEAETVVGTEIGYRVTTTINNVTTESIEFLESGVILKVTPTVDRSGRIMLDIFPEVSTGVVSDDGIPSKATTQVSTRMLVSDGKTVFLGGLIQNQINNTREGIPGLGDVPIIGGLFSNRSKSIVSTEIVVLITPRIVDYTSDEPQVPAIERVEVINEIIDAELLDTEKDLEKAFDGNSSPGASDDLGDRSK
jgi:type II secretory pathway component GspD/PulD (secretin)